MEEEKVKRKTVYVLLAVAVALVFMFSTVEMRVLYWHFFLDTPSGGTAPAEYDWFKNPYFTSPSITYESGVLAGERVELSISKDWKWGLRGYTWGDGIHPIEECSFTVYKAGTDDYNVLMYGCDGTNRWAVCTLIQGWVWGGQSPADWCKPYPVRVESCSKMSLEAWVYHRGGPHPHPRLDWWKNCLFDVWFKDGSGKILMIDIYFSGGGADWWTENEYHMAYSATQVPAGVWSHVEVDLKPLVEEALFRANSRGFSFDANTLKLYQAEILLELKNAWGSLDVGMCRLTYSYGGSGG